MVTFTIICLYFRFRPSSSFNIELNLSFVIDILNKYPNCLLEQYSKNEKDCSEQSQRYLGTVIKISCSNPISPMRTSNQPKLKSVIFYSKVQPFSPENRLWHETPFSGSQDSDN